MLLNFESTFSYKVHYNIYLKNKEIEMKRFITKATKAAGLFFFNPKEFLTKLRPYFFRAKSGIIKINGIIFNIDLELDSAMLHMYFGSYQYKLINLMRRFLGEGDTFIDIGANVGYISACALGFVGKSGNVHAFEPVPKYFARLKKIHEDNPDYNLHLNSLAVGEYEGKAKIAVTNLPNIGWNTMVPDFMSKDTISEEIEINVIRLTDYLYANDIHNMRFVKIDTEGFELPIMKGFQKYLFKIKELPIIVIEIAPSAYSKLNSTCSELADLMSKLGYVSKTLDCIHTVQIDQLDQTTDVLFIPKSIAQHPAARDGA